MPDKGRQWISSADGMPEPMPPMRKNPKPKPTPKPTPTSTPKPKTYTGGGIGNAYTTSIGVGGMSFDHKMT